MSIIQTSSKGYYCKHDVLVIVPVKLESRASIQTYKKFYFCSPFFIQLFKGNDVHEYQMYESAACVECADCF